MLFLPESLPSVCCVSPRPLVLSMAVTGEEAVVAFMVAAEAVSVAVGATMEAAVLSADTTVVDTAATTAVGITAAVAHMAVTVPTEVVAPLEACAEDQTRDVRVREDPGPGRVEARGTHHPAGIRLHDPATVAWLEDRATLRRPLAVGVLAQELLVGIQKPPTLQLLTVSGMASGALTAGLRRVWLRERD